MAHCNERLTSKSVTTKAAAVCFTGSHYSIQAETFVCLLCFVFLSFFLLNFIFAGEKAARAEREYEGMGR